MAGRDLHRIDNDTVRTVAAANGFDAYHTGGGCMALRRGAGRFGILITDTDGTRIPSDPTAPVFIGWEDNRTGEVVLQVEFPDLADAIRALHFGPDSIPADLWPGEAVLWTADEFWNAERYQGGR
jgi:hypothetical protein